MIVKDCSELFEISYAKTGMKVLQITSDDIWHGNVYPETKVFLADDTSFLISTEEGHKICYPDRGYETVSILNNKEDGETITGVIVSPEGRYIYYMRITAATSALWRLDTENFKSEEMVCIDGNLPGTNVKPHHFYGIGTMSSDGKRYATSACLGDGKTPNSPFGLLTFDVEKGTVSVVASDPKLANAHLQYSKSTLPDASHDLLIQMNHGCQTDASGKFIRMLRPAAEGGLGVDIHVISDDGTNWRDLPFGRDGIESCIGHQAWRSDSEAVITITLENDDPTYGMDVNSRQEIIVGWPIPTDPNAPHIGRKLPGAKRINLSEGFPDPRFCHFYAGADGKKFAFDTFFCKEDTVRGQRLYTGIDVGEGPLKFEYILNNRGNFGGAGSTHAHPIFTPNDKHMLFNSDVSGKSQIYMVTDVVFAK